MKRQQVASWIIPGSEIVHGWTLQDPDFFGKDLEQPDNFLAPGAIIFASAAEAEAFRAATPMLASRSTYEVWLPGTFAESTTTKRSTAHIAFHLWHKRHGTTRSPKCGLCMHWPTDTELPATVLLAEALIVNPTTGLPAGWPVQ